MVHYEQTQYGFKFGAAEITRACSDDKKSWSIMMIETAKENLQVYVTKTGKVRIFSSNGKEWSNPKNKETV